MASVELLFSVAQQLSRTLFPLSDGLSTEQTFAAYLRTFGWVVDPGAFQIADVRAAVPIASELATVTQVFTEISASQDYIAPQRYLDLVDAFKSTLDVLFNTAGSAAPPGIPAGAWTTFTTELVDQLIVTDMEQRRPLLTALLIMAGIVVSSSTGGDPLALWTGDSTRVWSQTARACDAKGRSQIGR